MTDPAAIKAGCALLDLSVEELWLGYVSVGGDLTIAEIGRFLADDGGLVELDYDRLAQALNDRFIDVNLDHPIAYSDG